MLKPPASRSLLVFGHGAGAGMRHSFMQAMAERLAERDVATFRYQFPYMEKGGRRPDYSPILLKTVRSAVAAASEAGGDLPLFGGGKSMGGRMTSLAAASKSIERLLGIVFFGFPLHPPSRPGTDRADHLADVRLPMLFLQGTRDRLAPLGRLAPVYEGLGERATLHVVIGADHGFRVLRRSRRSDEEVLDELASATEKWIDTVLSVESGRP